MEQLYQTKCLQLILAISKALDKLEEKDYESVETILRESWREAVGDTGAAGGWLVLR